MPDIWTVDPETGASVRISGRTSEELETAAAQWQAKHRARQARQAYIGQVAHQARQALELLDQIRTANAAFLAATPPATTADRLVFLYNQQRAQAQAGTVLASVATGLIELFGVVVPALSDLLDEGGADGGN